MSTFGPYEDEVQFPPGQLESVLDSPCYQVPVMPERGPAKGTPMLDRVGVTSGGQLRRGWSVRPCLMSSGELVVSFSHPR